jgi:predicted phosphodiesterase
VRHFIKNTVKNLLSKFLRKINGLILLVSILSITGFSSDPVREPFSSTTREVKGEPSIVFMSDIQSPLWFETLALKSDNNEEATQSMLSNIGYDSSVAALFLLGDITALGSFSSYWDGLFEKTTSIRKAHIPVFATFGNHEYQPFESKGREHFAETFPYVKPDWYCKRIRNVGLIILNSNFSYLDENQKKEQNRWYLEALKKFDKDSTIAIILVGCHHSPYTNSNIMGPSSGVQTFFVQPFLQSEKAKVFLSGHSHAFEHFKISDKDFFVIGGGGGLLHPLLQDKEQRWHDFSFQNSERGFFHYIRFILSTNILKMQVVKPLANRVEFQIINVYEIILN